MLNKFSFKIKVLVLIFPFLYATFLSANVNAVVTIAPQKTFVKAIGGDKVDVAVMVKAGSSPHTYEPKPSQMKDIAKANLYFALDLEFEKIWLKRFKTQNKNLKIINTNLGIKKLKMKEHNHHDAHHKHSGLDPHIWTSPANVKIIAKNTYEALAKEDAKNKEYYKSNYEKFLKQITQTDANIKKILSKVKTNRKFMVFHPAWGYFAKEYNLTQVAIEAGGKSPKAKQLIHIIEEVKEENIKTIFVAPEFSSKSALLIAKESGANVVKISTLAPNWSENLLKFANSIH